MEKIKKYNTFINESKNQHLDKSTSDGCGMAYEYLTHVVENAIENGKMKIIYGERKWKNLILITTQLVWERNMEDGYNMDIYVESDRGFKKHIGTIKNGKVINDTEHLMDNFDFQKHVLKRKNDDLVFNESSKYAADIAIETLLIEVLGDDFLAHKDEILDNVYTTLGMRTLSWVFNDLCDDYPQLAAHKDAFIDAAKIEGY